MGGKVFLVLRAVPVVIDQRRFCLCWWDIWQCLKSLVIFPVGGSAVRGGMLLLAPNGWKPGMLFYACPTVHSIAPCPPTKKDAKGTGLTNALRGNADDPSFISDCT